LDTLDEEYLALEIPNQPLFLLGGVRQRQCREAKKMMQLGRSDCVRSRAINEALGRPHRLGRDA
jgi:hypothetical protein